jgi:hypothetical protein
MTASCGAKDTFGASAGKQIYESDGTSTGASAEDSGRECGRLNASSQSPSKRLFRLVRGCFSRLAPATSWRGQASNTPRKATPKNVITHACIHKIASAASSVALQLQKGEQGDLVDVHPVLDLLRRRNPMNSGSDFIYSLIQLVAGF